MKIHKILKEIKEFKDMFIETSDTYKNSEKTMNYLIKYFLPFNQRGKNKKLYEL